nr:hypothetical protein [Tanacetum cinerariifolium]
MACSVPHNDDDIQDLIQKQIDEYMVRQKVILDLALQFDNACTAKEYLRKAYEKCNDIPQESRALIDTFLKEGSDKDYELNLSIYGKTAKIEKQMNANTRVEPSPLTPNPVRIIRGPAGIVQQAKLLKENVFILDSDGALISTQEYMQKVVEDVGTIPGTIHYKVIGDGGYGKDITVEAAMILVNVLVFTPKPSKHYLNITMRNMVKVFRKDLVHESGSG